MTQNVVKFGDPQNPSWLTENPDSVDNPVLTFFLDYWRDKRGAAALPLRSSFVPKDIRGHLQWVVTVDAIPDTRDFRFRVVGTRASEYFLGDGTGKTVREAYAGADESFIAGVEWMYRHTCELRLPLRLSAPSSRFHNIYFPAFDALYLPYSSDGEHADRIVNIFWYNRLQIVDRGVTPNSIAV